MDLLRTKASSADRDYLCEEIAEALRRKIVVIPVRVGREGQLPPLPHTNHPEIRDLVQYQKRDVTYEHFGRDASALVDAITTVRRHLGLGQYDALQEIQKVGLQVLRIVRRRQTIDAGGSILACEPVIANATKARTAKLW